MAVFGHQASRRPTRFLRRLSIEPLEDRRLLASQPYNWQNVPIGGGGYVTGLVYSPTVPNLVYARTDVGGAYRFDSDQGKWTALTDHLAYNDSLWAYVDGIAIDPSDSNRLYAVLGTYTQWWAGNAGILRSTDRGATWQRTDLPFKMGGNEDGRGNGERLTVDPNQNNILYLGTRKNGLWKSTNYGATWNQVSSFPVNTTPNGVGLNFVQFIKASGTPGSATPTIYVGLSQTGNNLYRSTDAGVTWQVVPNPGLSSQHMPLRNALDSIGNMYITYSNSSGPSGAGNPNGTFNGALWKLNLSSGAWTNVTPVTNSQGGLSGISVDAQNPNHIVMTTVDRWWAHDDVYRSTDGGATWTDLRGSDEPYPNNLVDQVKWDNSAQPYVSDPGIGWPTTIVIDPFNSNQALIAYGGGVVKINDLSSADTGAPTHWGFFNYGLEETVQIDLISPATGAPLITAAGDVGGYRFTSLTNPPQSSYNILSGTSRGIDYAEFDPNILVRTADDSPKIAYSRDNGVTWTGFSSAPSGAGNANDRSLALSADGNRVVWDAQGAPLSYATWNGSSWSAWTSSTWSGSTDIKPVSDRVNSNRFYISDGSNFYSSINGGASWTLMSSSAPSGTLRASFAAEGDLWIGTTGNGLWHSTNFGATWTRVASAAVSTAYQVGFGKSAPGQSYPTIFIAGSSNNTTGFFRSDDGGATWTTISDAEHQYGYVGPIVGDRNVYGRCYIGAGARGIIYGEIQSTAPFVTTAAAASPNPVTGAIADLSVLGTDDGGEASLTYTWRVAHKPPGSAAPSFSVNGTNASKNTTVTFSQEGFYSFDVAITDAQGHTMVSAVGVNVSSIPIDLGIFTDANDIGSPSPTGSSNYNPGSGLYTVSGGGSDIWNNSDQFQFISRNITGNGSIIARVTSVENTNAWAKAGIMFRDSFAAGAMFADVVVTPSSGVSFQWRNAANGNSNYVQITGQTAPKWVKLTRNGNSFTAYYATTTGTPTAANWIQIGGPQTIAMNSAAKVGLAVTSHNNGTLCTSIFSNVSVTPTLPDYNGNGSVDAADYVVWRKTLGSTTNLQANGDDTGPSAGIIDQADYAIWRTNFGNTAAAAGSGSAQSAVNANALPVVTTATTAALSSAAIDAAMAESVAAAVPLTSTYSTSGCPTVKRTLAQPGRQFDHSLPDNNALLALANGWPLDRQTGRSTDSTGDRLEYEADDAEAIDKVFAAGSVATQVAPSMHRGTLQLAGGRR